MWLQIAIVAIIATVFLVRVTREVLRARRSPR